MAVTDLRSFPQTDFEYYRGYKNNENQKDGVGVYKYDDSYTYEGHWENNVRSGQGTLTCTGPVRSAYRGGWRNDLKQG